MTSYFIADLHLDDSYPEQLAWFSQFVTHCQKTRVEALYILGDLFDVWVGDDVMTTARERVAKEILHLTQAGIRVYFQHGNRDFMLGSQYAKSCGMSLLSSEHVVTLYDKRVLLMHGDSLCRKDWRYQLYRTCVQSRLSKAIIGKFPRKWRIDKAKTIRANSTKRNRQLDLSLMDVTERAVTRALAVHRADVLIHGHTHQPVTYSYGNKIRFVLGAWESSNIQFVISDEGGIRLASLSFS